MAGNVQLLTPDKDLGSLALRILNVTLNLVHSEMVGIGGQQRKCTPNAADSRSSMDERAVRDPLARTLADLKGANGRRKLLRKSIVDTVLYEDTVGTDASLS